ncbi:uncharacterized protein BO72DRAFT_716 [Aspergillus fijiensis CBS 313.89]|uniref:Secreted protein n=1 Tax=Aspergillus fijiensis CBS 313.89 TaxID=1448319 RepID=A0A8G1S0E8_9EURO|nr:uncharacterized protein BO72DRAFT_716 [Aspergillus fijiensis CBS 313.89]RAK82524.1 hypothetical protein BO72DRAFT_716 [Aspergillus fijiensis CBS 313.89]
MGFWRRWMMLMAAVVVVLVVMMTTIDDTNCPGATAWMQACNSGLNETTQLVQTSYGPMSISGHERKKRLQSFGRPF